MNTSTILAGAIVLSLAMFAFIIYSGNKKHKARMLADYRERELENRARERHFLSFASQKARNYERFRDIDTFPSAPQREQKVAV
jgi:hypothetical protein